MGLATYPPAEPFTSFSNLAHFFNSLHKYYNVSKQNKQPKKGGTPAEPVNTTGVAFQFQPSKKSPNPLNSGSKQKPAGSPEKKKDARHKN